MSTPQVTQTFDMAIGEYGQDYAVPVGTPIYTPVAGTVSTQDAGKKEWGKRVIVTAANGISFAVGHLTQFAVTAGQKVGAGTLVGYSGGAPSDPSSGVSTGPHVETQFFNMTSKGPQYINPVDVFKQFSSWEQSIFSGIGGAAASLNPLSGVGDAINAATSAFTSLLWRIFFNFLGFVLFVVGVWLVVRGDAEKATSDALDQVQKLAPAAQSAAPEEALPEMAAAAAV